MQSIKQRNHTQSHFLNKVYPNLSQRITSELNLNTECLAMAVASILRAYPNQANWNSPHYGVVMFVKDYTHKTFYLRYFDMQQGKILPDFDEEFYGEVEPNYNHEFRFFQFSSLNGYQLGIYCCFAAEYDNLISLITVKVQRRTVQYLHDQSQRAASFTSRASSQKGNFVSSPVREPGTIQSNTALKTPERVRKRDVVKKYLFEKFKSPSKSKSNSDSKSQSSTESQEVTATLSRQSIRSRSNSRNAYMPHSPVGTLRKNLSNAPNSVYPPPDFEAIGRKFFWPL